MTELYRHFDANRRLLYVGVSLSTLERLRRHKRSSHWFAEVVYITIERFETRELALAAEKAAVKAERPRFNLMLTGSRITMPVGPQIPLAEKLKRMRAEKGAA